MIATNAYKASLVRILAKTNYWQKLKNKYKYLNYKITFTLMLHAVHQLEQALKSLEDIDRDSIDTAIDLNRSPLEIKQLIEKIQTLASSLTPVTKYPSSSKGWESNNGMSTRPKHRLMW